MPAFSLSPVCVPQGLCGPCRNTEDLKCAAGFKPAKSSFVQRYRCKYSIKDRTGMAHKYLGCRRLCENVVYVSLCFPLLWSRVFLASQYYFCS